MVVISHKLFSPLPCGYVRGIKYNLVVNIISLLYIFLYILGYLASSTDRVGTTMSALLVTGMTVLQLLRYI